MKRPRTSSSCVRLSLFALAITGFAIAIEGQVVPAATGNPSYTSGSTSAIAAATMSNASAPIAKINGPNLSVESASQHNSVNGWYSLITPDLSYRLNEHISFDSSVPYYISYQNFVAVKSGTTTSDVLERTSNLLGDTTISGHLEGQFGDFSASVGATGALPTGDQRYALTAGVPTYNVTAHGDYSIGPFNPDMEIGEGNSSNLTHHAIKKGYTAVGSLANFQAGTSIDLPLHASLDLEAYEDMPIGTQNVFGTVTRANKKGKTGSRQILQGAGTVEDNGFNTELDLPIAAHLTLSGVYDRSLIQSNDIAGIALKWTWRVPAKMSTPR